jgi:hypothetical protein
MSRVRGLHYLLAVGYGPRGRTEMRSMDLNMGVSTPVVICWTPYPEGIPSGYELERSKYGVWDP